MTSPPLTLPAQVHEQAAAAASRLASQLAVPPPPEAADDRSPGSDRWRAQSLSKGAAGIAVLHGTRARDGLASWESARSWLASACHDELSAGPGAGLWYGAPAVAFAVTAAAPPGTANTAMRQLDGAVRTLTRRRLDAAHARISAAQRPTLAEFDLVRGLTGLGAYLFHRNQDQDASLLRDVLAYLVRLTEPVPASDHAGQAVPGWWTLEIPSSRPGREYAAGHADLAMAHGIAGPLALLAITMRGQITVPGHAEAISRITSWLSTWRRQGPNGPWWPGRVTLRGLHTAPPGPALPPRPSWCYGTPGIARALQLAALAAGDDTLRQTAEQAIVRCLADNGQMSLITGPAVCHGLAGLALTAWRASLDAATPAIGAHLPPLIQALASCSDDASSAPGLIEGTAGVALVLHTIATHAAPGGWETCLLTSSAAGAYP